MLSEEAIFDVPRPQAGSGDQGISKLPGTGEGADGECQQFCAELPSSRAAADFIDGRPGGVISVVTSTVLRGVLITAGVYLAQGKDRDLAKAFRYGSTGAATIELFVLGYTWWKKRS